MWTLPKMQLCTQLEAGKNRNLHRCENLKSHNADNCLLVLWHKGNCVAGFWKHDGLRCCCRLSS
jgi:hypothetical protein